MKYIFLENVANVMLVSSTFPLSHPQTIYITDKFYLGWNHLNS